MAHIFEFWISSFWITFFIFFFNQSNFFRLLFIAELIWGLFYSITILFGLEIGNICLISFGFFILVFATFEFVLGIILNMCIKEFSKGLNNLLNFSQITKINSLYRWKNFFFNNFKF